MPPPEFPDVESLVPHRGPLRLVRRILEAGEGWVVCEGRFPAAGPYSDGEAVPALLGVELAAQAAAVLQSLARAAAGTAAGPRVGYLVGVRDLRLAVARLPAGEPLVARARSAGGAAALAMYEVSLHGLAGEELLAGTISTFLTDQATG